MKKSEKREGILGRKYIQHTDDDGSNAGQTERRDRIFGDDYDAHLDSDGGLTGTSEARESILGDDYVQHFDESGNKSGYSEAVEGIFGDKYVEHRDDDGQLVGRSEAREGIFGNEYTVHDGVAPHEIAGDYAPPENGEGVFDNPLGNMLVVIPWALLSAGLIQAGLWLNNGFGYFLVALGVPGIIAGALLAFQVLIWVMIGIAAFWFLSSVFF